MVKATRSTTIVAPAEQRVTLYNISWQRYEKLLEVLGEDRSARVAYHKGTLEIMTPLEDHESASGSIGRFVEILTEEMNLNRKSLESTRLNRPDLESGAEPDKCYYIQNEPAVRGRNVDLTVDPPPDLVVEVDITHTDINKRSLYAGMGVPEFWRYDGKILRIHQLQQVEYQEVENSPTFPWVRKSVLYKFLQQCHINGETQADRSFRAWVRLKLLELQVKESQQPSS